jgi:hypothetical protein
MMIQLTVGDCVRTGWEGFKKNAGTAIGIVVIYGIISSVGNIIPIVNFAVAVVVTPLLSAGLAIFALKAARGGEGQIEDLFKGFNEKQFGSFLGAYWLFVMIVMAAFVPPAIGFGIDVAINGGFTNLFPYVTIAVSVVTLVSLIIVILRFSMVTYLIIDGLAVMDAFRESARITKGFTGTLFMVALVNVLFIIAGILLLFMGLLVAIPLTLLIFAAAYTKLKPEAPAAAVQTTSPDVTAPPVTPSM